MRSANEIAGMVLKAARGAGMPLGSAERLARAAPALVEKGALDQITPLFELPFDRAVYENGTVSGGHPLQAAITWCDLKAAGLEVDLRTEVSKPLLAALYDKNAPVGPFEVDDAIWSLLARYAARTLVPETEVSRLAGAGAGLTDND